MWGDGGEAAEGSANSASHPSAFSCNHKNLSGSSRNKLVSAGLGDQQLGLRGIALDLLPQPIYVRFECMCRHVGVVAPDLQQQDVAGNDLLAGSVEVLENRGFFLGQANFGALLVDEQLGGGLECVLADRENGIFTLLMLTELSPNARQEDSELERLRDVVIGAGIEAQDRVSVRSIAGEHDDRRLEARLAQSFAGLTAIHVRQPDVENDQVEM